MALYQLSLPGVFNKQRVGGRLSFFFIFYSIPLSCIFFQMDCRIMCSASPFLPWGLDTLGRIYGFISFNLPAQEHSTFASYFLILVAKDVTKNWRRCLSVLQFGGCSSSWRGRHNSKSVQWLVVRVHSKEAKMTGVRPPQVPLKAYSC